MAALWNAIAELRGGWEHYSHRDYDVIINRLFRETNDKDLPLYFRAAERLHANFYHNFMTKDEYELHREYVLKLINKLRDLLKR